MSAESTVGAESTAVAEVVRLDAVTLRRDGKDILQQIDPQRP